MQDTSSTQLATTHQKSIDTQTEFKVKFQKVHKQRRRKNFFSNIQKKKLKKFKIEMTKIV